MKKFILALDQGTTSSRAVVFDHDINKISSSQKEFPQIFPHPGWVEHDPMQILDSQIFVMKDALEKAKISLCDASKKIAAVGITNQRETVILWEKSTGRPVYNAIVWQCRRTAKMADELIATGKSGDIQKRTGLIPDAYFSATKIKWILDNVSGVREKAERGEILAGTVDTWLLWWLSGKKCHTTDYTNASRTMLFNIHTLDWDDDLLKLFGIPRKILPNVMNSSEIYAMTDEKVCGFSAPIASIIGDQQSALFGQTCFSAGDAKCTFGTGCFLLTNTGEIPIVSKHRLLTTIALGISGKIEYALEGSVFMGGALIKWLRDELKIISTAHECDTLAESVPDSNGVVIVPAFTGLGAPYWDANARGTIFGLTRGTTKAHICRAALEAIAFQVRDEIECMKDDISSKIPSLKVDGGASVSDLMMQFEADILGIPIIRPENTETTVTGAAFLAGLATGFWATKDEIQKQWKTEKEFSPKMTKQTADELYEKWKLAVECVRKFRNSR